MNQKIAQIDKLKRFDLIYCAVIDVELPFPLSCPATLFQPLINSIAMNATPISGYCFFFVLANQATNCRLNENMKIKSNLIHFQKIQFGFGSSTDSDIKRDLKKNQKYTSHQNSLAKKTVLWTNVDRKRFR